MNALAILLSGILLLVAAIHVLWATGVIWPGGDEKSQARMVVGARDISRMPPKSSSAAVALAVFAAALFPLMWTALIPYPLPQTMVWLGMITLAAVFLLRGIAGYTAPFRNMFPEEPFATLDRRYFSPLCLAIGAGFAALIWLGANI